MLVMFNKIILFINYCFFFLHSILFPYSTTDIANKNQILFGMNEKEEGNWREFQEYDNPSSAGLHAPLHAKNLIKI